MKGPFTFLLAVFFSLFANAQKVHELKKADDVHLLGADMYLFEDTSAAMTIDEVVSERVQAQFRPAEDEVPHFNITYSNVWCRVRITTREAERWFLEYGFPCIQEVEMYQINNGKTQRLEAGISKPRERRSMIGGKALFPLDIAPGDTIDCYLKLVDIAPLKIIVKAGTAEDYLDVTSRLNMYHGLYFGFMVLMILYNLFLFFTNHDRVYIYYALYVLFSALFIAFFNGYVASMIEPLIVVFETIPVLVPAAFGVFGMLFTIRFLNTKKYAPGLHKVIVVFTISVVIPVLISAAGYRHLSIMLIQGAGLLLALISIVTGIMVLRRGYRPAKFYVLGFGAYMVGLLILILCDVFGVNEEALAMYSLEIGSAIEAVMLSFAIGDKLNNANREKQEAQAAALKSAQENEKLVKEQNIVLERKVNERTQEIQLQKAIIEEKNKDILSSLHYARRIQSALLASGKLLSTRLPEHFVLYKPKDIVSGDFYWAAEAAGGKFLLLTGDCTGHGVPGAFMSLLNISMLHEIVVGRSVTRPDEVLDQQREAIIAALNPEGSSELSRDGMDCSLCSFDFQRRTLELACANNGIWILRGAAFLSFPPDKQPVGWHEGKTEPFRLQHVDLQPGDIVYTFTDGFADQFGGPKGKKFKYKQIQQHLLQTCGRTMAQQREHMENLFETWRGPLEQIDDVLLIGIRIR